MQLSETAGLPLTDLVREIGATLPAPFDPSIRLRGGASLEMADASNLVYMDHPRHAAKLQRTRAGACLVLERFAHLVPSHTVALVVPDPRWAYAKLLARLHPEELKPRPVLGRAGIPRGCFVHPGARIGGRVVLDPGVVIGEGVVVGEGTTIGANAVLGPEVFIGQDCSIAAGVTLARCTVGDRVFLHPGVRIGQDGFGYDMSAAGHLKVPQLGRVLIGDDVEIGANSTVDRGSSRDTVIGHGTKIDNLVQIAHNVRIGCHCIIVAQVGIAGSTVLEDFVAVGGHSAIAGHLHIGRGAQLAAASRLTKNVPAGERWGGMPAKPLREWFREQTTLNNLAKRPRRRVISQDEVQT